MECRHGRRGRKGRCCSQQFPFPPYPMTSHSSSIHTDRNPGGGFWDTVYSFFVLSSLIAVVYLMLQYHCDACGSSKGSINSITKNIEDIATNLAVMKTNYVELESKIKEFSQEFPKLEGQIEVLEALTSTIEQQRWNPRTGMCLPNVDISLTNSAGESQKRNCSFEERLQRPIRV